MFNQKFAHIESKFNRNGHSHSSTGTSHYVSSDPQVKRIFELVTQVAGTDATVLIVGESGTGKELVARELHRQCTRPNSAFLAVNCGAIAESLQESELFGHARGAFTGAMEARVGKFESASGGTLFLDEISEMKLSMQVKLLRLLQFGEYSPVGMAQNRYANVRVIAATNSDLSLLIDSGQFRRDLYYRINIIRIDLPPLRVRTDIHLLITYFLHYFRKFYDKPLIEIDSKAVERLCRYDFPGNIRELENIIQRAVILCRDVLITVADLPQEVRMNEVRDDVYPVADNREKFHRAKARVVAEFEREYLITKLTLCSGNISRAAKEAGLSERCFHEKLKAYGISSKNFRPNDTTKH